MTFVGRVGTFIAVLAIALLAGPCAALAIPLFSHEYGVTCQKCHTVIPHLNDFGEHFMANGERIREVTPVSVVPVSTKFNFADSSVNQGSGSDGRGLPKAILDEMEVFVAGLIGPRANYFVEQYAIDGGEHGMVRDAWVNDRINPWDARIPLYVQAGSFTLPVPIDPETFRESYQHYTVFDQTVGNNPFNFFAPKIGAQVTVGDTLSGTSLRIFGGPGHDRQSGINTVGTDFMVDLQESVGPLTLSTYNYGGTRPVLAILDRFQRTGYALTFKEGKWTSESLLQTGWDSNCNGSACASSGGFTQLRYAIGPRLFALARYEGTNDPSNGLARDGVLLLGFRPSHNARVTIEGVLAHAPRNTMNLQYTVGY